jgi:exopolysaccharide production protein ExoQ
VPPSVATIVYAIGIIGLFVLDRDRKAQTSKALWIPVVYLWITGSREVSRWLAAFGVVQAGAGTRDESIEGNPLDRIVYTGLFVLGAVVLFRRGPQVARLLRANLPILLFFSYCCVSVLWSDYPAVAFKRWIKALGDLVIVVIVLTDPDRLTAVRRLLSRVAFVLIPLSILLIKYYPDLGRHYQDWRWTVVYDGVTTNKNALGMICLLFGIGSLWRLIEVYRHKQINNRTRHLITHAVLLAMILWLLFIAGSMTSTACFLLASTLIVGTSFWALARRPSVVHIVVAGIVAVSVSSLLLNTSGSVLETMGKDPSLTGRTELWELVLSMTGNPLIGTGFESFWLGWRRDKIWSTFWWHPNEAHNGYLEVFLNLGWVGVALLGAVIAKGYRNALVACRREPGLGRLRLGYFVIGLVYSLTEAGFRMMDPVWVIFLLAIMAVPKHPTLARVASASLRSRVDYVALGLQSPGENAISIESTSR